MNTGAYSTFPFYLDKVLFFFFPFFSSLESPLEVLFGALRILWCILSAFHCVAWHKTSSLLYALSLFVS